MASRQARGMGSRNTSRQVTSPKRTRQHEPTEEDHELELESLIQLNLDAASGELPSQQSTETVAGNSSDFPSYEVPLSTSATLKPSPVTSATAPVVKSPAPEELVRKPRRIPQKLSSKAATSTLANNRGFLPFSADEDANVEEGENPSKGVAVLRPRVDRYDDRDAVEALVRGLQPFLANNGDAHSDTAYPLALPVPRVGVAENSGLKEFRDEMIERHQECEVPLPESDDLARFFMELKDGQGIHMQLPTLAFPALQNSSRYEGQFVLVGNLLLEKRLKKAKMETVNDSRRLQFDLSQQNVPSLMAEVFTFQHAKNESETGSVKMQAVDLVASVAGSLTFTENPHDGVNLGKRRDAILNKIGTERKNFLEQQAERKRKAEMATDPLSGSGGGGGGGGGKDLVPTLKRARRGKASVAPSGNEVSAGQVAISV